MRSRIALVGKGMGRTILTLQPGKAKPWTVGIVSQTEVSISDLTVDVNGQRQVDQVVETKKLGRPLLRSSPLRVRVLAPALPCAALGILRLLAITAFTSVCLHLAIAAQ